MQLCGASACKSPGPKHTATSPAESKPRRRVRSTNHTFGCICGLSRSCGKDLDPNTLDRWGNLIRTCSHPFQKWLWFEPLQQSHHNLCKHCCLTSDLPLPGVSESLSSSINFRDYREPLVLRLMPQLPLSDSAQTSTL